MKPLILTTERAITTTIRDLKKHIDKAHKSKRTSFMYRGNEIPVTYAQDTIMFLQKY